MTNPDAGTYFGQQVDITAPDAPADDPMRFTLRDRLLGPAGRRDDVSCTVTPPGGVPRRRPATVDVRKRRLPAGSCGGRPRGHGDVELPRVRPHSGPTGSASAPAGTPLYDPACGAAAAGRGTSRRPAPTVTGSSAQARPPATAASWRSPSSSPTRARRWAIGRGDLGQPPRRPATGSTSSVASSQRAAPRVAGRAGGPTSAPRRRRTTWTPWDLPVPRSLRERPERRATGWAPAVSAEAAEATTNERYLSGDPQCSTSPPGRRTQRCRSAPVPTASSAAAVVRVGAKRCYPTVMSGSSC